MNLYEVVSIEREVELLAAENDGVITEEQMQRLVEAQTASLDKIKNLCKWIRSMEMHIVACKAEQDRLRAAIKHNTNTIKSVKKYMADFVRGSGKIVAGTFTLTTRVSEVVEVADDFDEPGFMREKVTREPDKATIKVALKAGREVTGAVLQSRINLQIK